MTCTVVKGDSEMEELSGFDGCQREEKHVVAGLCLSFDLLKGICLETSMPCEAQDGDDMDCND